MKNIFILLGAFIIGSSCLAQQYDDTITVYYLIRHAEKDRSDSLNENPYLKQEGLARALKWASTFDDVAFDEIYSTPYNRTKQTAEPTAFKQKKRISLYNPSDLDVDLFMEQTAGKTVLIVGHSNTTPHFANKLLGVEKYDAMDDSDNSGLYIITVINGVSSGMRISVN